jgi:CBS domain-containing protein
MKDVEKIKIAATSTIKKALSIIDSGAVKIALVMDIDNKLLGTLGDGDIRRGLLKKNFK